MMSRESLKKLGILGVSFGLIASPLAFGGGEGEYEPATTEQEESSGSGEAMGSSGDNAGTSGTEYENEEQETPEWETSGSDDGPGQEYEEEEEEWDEPEAGGDDEASTW